MVRGWHIDFFEEHDRTKVVDVLTKKYPPEELYLTVGQQAYIHAQDPLRIQRSEWGSVTLDDVKAVCMMYAKVPSDDSTITFTERGGMFGIMQLSSGRGSWRKAKNVVRLEVLYLLMQIADDLEIKYTCYSG